MENKEKKENDDDPIEEEPVKQWWKINIRL